MNNNWLEIVKKELLSAVALSGAAVPGAKLRSRIAHAAKAQGLQFPPAEMGKFSAFIESLGSELLVQRRPGSDILISPADRPELLAAEGAKGRNVRLRQDLFDALTTISPKRQGTAYYIPELDAVKYDGEGQLPQTAVALPPSSLGHEIKIRERFVQEVVGSADTQSALNSALQSPSALRDFGEAIRAYGLVRDWHQFRMGSLNATLKKWADDNALAWQPAWVETSSPTASSEIQAAPTPVSLDSREQLELLANTLTTDDLARISVPLDIVLRLLKK